MIFVLFLYILSFIFINDVFSTSFESVPVVVAVVVVAGAALTI